MPPLALSVVLWPVHIVADGNADTPTVGVFTTVTTIVFVPTQPNGVVVAVTV